MIYKEFKIGDLFNKIQTKKLPYKTGDLKNKHDEIYCLPALTAGIENQGLSCFVPKENASILNNCISVSANGTNTGEMFYQDINFTVLQDSYALELKEVFSEHKNKNSYCFLITCMQKIIKGNFDWSNKAGWEKIKSKSISLPVIPNPDKNHEYTIDDIDWNYMETYIKELEIKYIKELEIKHIKELETYLSVTGLDDYHLTDEDKEILSRTVDMKEFKVKDILNVEQTKSVVSKGNLVKGNIPYVTRTANNNGYSDYCGNIDKLNKGNCITIGAETGIAYYQPIDFVAGNKIYRISRENLNEKQYLFLAGVLNKRVNEYSYSNARIPEKIKNENIALPIDENGEPDFEYMEKYIRAIEKQTIAKLYANNELILKTTKDLII